MMTMEVSNKSVKFMTPGAEVPMLELGHISYKLNMHFFYVKMSFILGIVHTN